MRVVKKEDFGNKWPFTVGEGILCEPKPNAAVFVYGGVYYALNGIATAHKYADLDPIWKFDPVATCIPGFRPRISVSDMIELALGDKNGI